MDKYRPKLQWPPLKRHSWPTRVWQRWRWRLRQVGRYAVGVALIGGVSYYYWNHRYNPTAPSSILTPSLVNDAMHGNPFWRRPAKAPNDKPWPARSGYLEGYPRLSVGGAASVVADNLGGTNDLMVKLIDRDRTPMSAVRIGFVKAKGEWEIEQVKPGHYDMRYLNLGNGRIRKSGPFEVTLKTSEKGKEYMGWRIGLFDRLDGNAHHEDIGSGDF
jgi:hypothetical protein